MAYDAQLLAANGGKQLPEQEDIYGDLYGKAAGNPPASPLVRAGLAGEAEPEGGEPGSAGLGRAVEHLLVEAVRDLLEERPRVRDATACLASFLKAHGDAILEAFFDGAEGDAKEGAAGGGGERATSGVIALAEKCGAADTLDGEGSTGALEPDPEPQLQPEHDGGGANTVELAQQRAATVAAAKLAQARQEQIARQHKQPMLTGAAAVAAARGDAVTDSRGHIVRVRMRKPKKAS